MLTLSQVITKLLDNNYTVTFDLMTKGQYMATVYEEIGERVFCVAQAVCATPTTALTEALKGAKTYRLAKLSVEA